MTRPRRPHQVALGERLREAARDRGLTSGEIATQLGVSSQAVRSWWTGLNAIPLDMLLAYADVVERPLIHFVSDAPTRDLISSLVLEVFGRLMADQPADQAIRSALGATMAISESEAQRLASDTTAIRYALDRIAGGNFQALTEADQLALIRRLVSVPGDAGTKGGAERRGLGVGKSL